MKTIYIVCLIALISAMIVTPAAAKTWYVDDDGGYDFTVIMDALNAAFDGDTVFVYNGTYGADSIYVETPNITLKGEGADVVTWVAPTPSQVIRMDSASGSILDGFTVVNSEMGIEVTANSPNCIIRNCVFDGLTTDESCRLRADNVTFENNVILNPACDYCALCVFGDCCTIVNNTIEGNTGAGISLEIDYPKDNIVTKNNLISNDYAGIELYDAGEGNKIYLNNFVDNGVTATTSGTTPPAVTYWNSTEQIEYSYNGNTYTNYLGNNWSDHTNGDADGDGIGDTAYVVPDGLGEDYRPLMEKFENYLGEAAEEKPDLIPTSLTSTALQINQSNSLTATIRNNGTAAVGSFNVTLKVEDTVIGNDTVASLGAGSSTNVTFTWTPTSAGTFNLTVTADYGDAVAESDETNNNLTVQATVQEILFDGTVMLTNGTTFAFVPANNASASYDVNSTTDLGALTATGLAFNASDTWYEAHGSFWLESIAGIENEAWPNNTWAIYINDAPAPNGLGGNVLEDGDNVKFYFCPANATTYAYITEDASYLVNITVSVTMGSSGIRFHDGWNFISTPKRLANEHGNASVVFAGVDTAGHTIWLYNSSTGNWDIMGADDVVKPLDGIWIYSNGTTEVPLTYDTYPLYLPPTKPLYPGWNAIGFSDTVPATANEALTSVEDEWAYLIGFDTLNQRYETSIINNAESGARSENRLMYPTKGYWIYMTEGGELAGISA